MMPHLTQFDIPGELVEQVRRGRCVLFLGADASLTDGETVGPPNHNQLAAALAEKYGLPANQSLFKTADDFLCRQPQNRHGLISFVSNEIERALTPTDTHYAIVETGFEAVVTTWYDRLLENAFLSRYRKVGRVVQGLDIAYATYTEGVMIVKLYGDLDQKNSLVLTQRDILRTQSDLSRKLEIVRPFLRDRPVIFVAWDPENDTLNRLYAAAIGWLEGHQPRSYIVWPEPSHELVAYWSQDNVGIISATPVSFLRTLTHLMSHTKQQSNSIGSRRVIAKPPYKSLDYFDPEDQDIFCGREVEARLVYHKILSYPLLTLFGQSGVGKTSLLRAGVVPLLQQEDYHYVYVRTVGEPLRTIRQEVSEALNLEMSESSSLLNFFQTSIDKDCKLIVILDQFEELFLRTTSFSRSQFWREIHECLGLQKPEVRFVFCLREDFLALLDEARQPLATGEPPPIPMILHDTYRLSALTADTAYLAIVEPARRAKCEIEPMLVDVLLGNTSMPNLPDSASAVDWSLAEANQKIPPPSLQIVMDQIYRQALKSAGHLPPEPGESTQTWQPPELRLTLDLYRSLGSVKHILANHIKVALDQVREKRGDRDVATALLKALVNSEGTKLALTKDEIVKVVLGAAALSMPGENSDLDCLKATRDALINLRLVRSFRIGDEVFYELAHDHMAAEIRNWISEEELQAKRAVELLQREFETWRSLGKLVDANALQIIYNQRDALKEISEEQLELLLHSSLALGQGVTYWRDHRPVVTSKIESELLEALDSRDLVTAERAVTSLARLASPSLVVKLTKLVENEFDDSHVRWIDPYGQEVVVQHTVLNALTVRQRRALLALGKMLIPEATEALERWTPPGTILIPAGPFLMGSELRSKEKPPHLVYLDAFWIDRYPVTNAQWSAFLASDAWYQKALWTEAGWQRQQEMSPTPEGWQDPIGKERCAVGGICWYEAYAYACWAGKTLLTEAQWEKAASGSELELQEKRIYPWGSQFDKNRCNTKESQIRGKTEVTRYSALSGIGLDASGDSVYGVSDMSGNVLEWTISAYRPYPYNPADGRDSATGTDHRVLRGGSFRLNEDQARIACRHTFPPDGRYADRGVRVAVVLTLHPNPYE